MKATWLEDLWISVAESISSCSKDLVDLRFPEDVMILSYAILGLVVLTAMAGYAVAPGPFAPLAFFYTTVGTALCSASANAFNQVLFSIFQILFR